MAGTCPWLPWAPCTMLSTHRDLLLSLCKCFPANSTLKSCFVLFEPSFVLRSANISAVLISTIATNLLLAISGASAAVTEWQFADTQKDRCFPLPGWRLGSCLLTHNSEKGGIACMLPENWRFMLSILSSPGVSCNSHQEERSWANAEGLGRSWGRPYSQIAIAHRIMLFFWADPNNE